MKKIVNRNFKGLTFTNGRYSYDGDLYIGGDTAIEVDIFVDGDLVVGGNLTTNNITVGGKIQVYGDFVANGNVVCSTVAVEGNATVNNGDFEAEQFCISGDLTVSGDTKAKRGISQVNGRLATTNLVVDRLYVGGDYCVKGKIYAPLQGGLFK